MGRRCCTQACRDTVRQFMREPAAGPGLPGGGVPLPRGPQLERVRCVECAFQCGFLDTGIPPDITHQGVALPDSGSDGEPPTGGRTNGGPNGGQIYKSVPHLVINLSPIWSRVISFVRTWPRGLRVRRGRRGAVRLGCRRNPRSKGSVSIVLPRLPDSLRP